MGRESALEGLTEDRLAIEVHRCCVYEIDTALDGGPEGRRRFLAACLSPTLTDTSTAQS